MKTEDLIPQDRRPDLPSVSAPTHSAMVRTVNAGVSGPETESFSSLGEITEELDAMDEEFNRGPKQVHLSYPADAEATVILAPQESEGDTVFSADSIPYLEGEIRKALANSVLASRIPAQPLMDWAKMTDEIMGTSILLAIHSATIAADYPMTQPDLPETDFIPGQEPEERTLYSKLMGEEDDLFRAQPEDSEGFVVDVNDEDFFSDGQ